VWIWGCQSQTEVCATGPQNKKGVIAGKIWEFFEIGCINVPVNLIFAESCKDKEASR
jgi:uncharacterized membrane protein YhdT